MRQSERQTVDLERRRNFSCWSVACLAFAERVSAREAKVVIEHILVDDFADRRTRSTAGSPAKQGANNGAGDKPERRTDGSAHETSGGACFCA